MNNSNTRRLLLALVAALALVSFSPENVEARGRRHVRQYYTTWSYHQQGGYYYRCYCYQPTGEVVNYRYHYVIYVPSQPQYVYYYNPYRQVYWGRASSNPAEFPGYSLLAEADRKGTLAEIPEEAFGELTETPAIPESKDGARLELPPSDLPVPVTARN